MEDKITSLQNVWVKKVVSLHTKSERDKEKMIILEGDKLIEGAIESGYEIVKMFSLDGRLSSTIVDEKVIKKMSTTSSPTDVIAIAKKPVWKFENPQRIILLDNIKDAGNLGTIIRTACAFGIDAILLYGDCVDEFSPKVLRASVGCAFKIPVIRVTKTDIIELRQKYEFISTVVNSQRRMEDVDFSRPFVLMFGSEANGLNEFLLNIHDASFTLPMKNSVESLNLAMSVGICLWELAKI
ncbi:MAG: RNA methyltransferase [Cyanobacteria bacterium SIG30]|nr:RNA methyltransferase [Cyanobacteria bacterium SIG30]